MSLIEIGFFVGLYVVLMLIGYRLLKRREEKSNESSYFSATTANQNYMNQTGAASPPLGSGIGKIQARQNYVRISSSRKAS